MSHISPVAQRLRITFGKSGPLIYTSNLDIAKIWERVLRRADLPILYTQGFNTRPRISLAMPLPLGISSECEILEIALKTQIDFCADSLGMRLQAVAPQGLTVQDIKEVGLRADRLHSRIDSAEYRIEFPDGINRDTLQCKLEALLARDAIIIERRRKRKRSVMDARPLILALKIAADVAGGDCLIAHLSVGDRGNMRPDQLLELLGLSQRYHKVHRFKLHIMPG